MQTRFAVLWIVVLLCVAVLVRILQPSVVPECSEVKAFALDELSRRCLVRFRRTPASSLSMVSGRTLDELQARAQCAMPSFVGTGCWSPEKRNEDYFYYYFMRASSTGRAALFSAPSSSADSRACCFRQSAGQWSCAPPPTSRTGETRVSRHSGTPPAWHTPAC